MSVLAYAAEEEVESACVHDSFLVCFAFSFYVSRIAVENVDILCRFVDLVEEVFVHE